MAAKAKLTVLNGKQANAIFSLEEGDKKVIGRDNNCHVQILDKGISRNHTVIEWKGNNFLLVDLGSTNGTFVNNKVVISKVLQNQDVIKIGQTEIRFEDVDSKPQAPVASFVMDELLEHSPNTIMERVDVGQSLCVSSQSLVSAAAKGKVVEDVSTLYLSTIYEVSNLVNEEHDLQTLFSKIMDKIMQVFKPDRGFLVMQDKDEFKVTIKKGVEEENAKLSHTILKKTIKEGISILSANAMLDDRFAGGMSIVSQEIKSVMSVPLESSNKILGAIYVDSLGLSNRFKKPHLDLLATIGKQAGIAIERAMLFEHFLTKEKLQQALDIAQNIQKSLLPSGAPEGFEYDLVGWNLTCDETGGDYYDFIELPGDRLGIALGDVSGHGIGAALLMATARAFLRALAIKCNEITTIMNELNRLLEQDMDDDKFMTLFYGELDTQNLILRFTNAGQEGPILYRKQENAFYPLETTGIPLGMMDDFEYEEGQAIRILPGDILILCTDGITEAMNHAGDQFGLERMMEVVRQGANKSANQIIKDCYDQVQKFCQGAPQRDDLTLVIIKFDRKMEFTGQKTFTRKIERV